MLLVNEPLVTRPTENRTNAPIVITPTPMPISDKGFFSTLADAMADNPLKKKAIEDTAPCATVKSFVKTPTPMAPIAIRKSRMFTVLRLEMCLRKYVPMTSNSPRRKTDELKTKEDGPIPRSLT